ncbi:Psi-producing oxygenase A [Lachnellula suecica]|uniref:Psi-producing oxygenase A n=1 Tax=Lachnellula suecica TaxID=602035 RepID=A0A8T9CQ13_9HELO|nr:Psi-producing oxygenase A [Lachnellula suecica]
MGDPYQAGEPYADTVAPMTGLLDDLNAIGFGGKPIDDREMMMEKLIAITASLPDDSKARLKLSQLIINTLNSSLQHPPMSYMGDQFKYRQPDGSLNSFITPQLGAAGTPYAKTCRSAKKLQGVRPDPGLLFDLLLSREKGVFKENPAGISAMLFYHATIIIHDVFRTSRKDANISDTSSYLDLAPLYGSSMEDQVAIRTMSEGLLKPDTFHEIRLLGQPPGVNVILVLYSRFHNYVADMLLKINEGGRFSLQPFDKDDPKEKAAAFAKQDHDLFNTARLVVGGMYMNISLHDYLRGLTNVHHSDSTWTLDPRIEIDASFGQDGVPRGVGGQVSAEFNLLYRFHPAISQRDEKWIDDLFTKEIFPDIGKPLDQLDLVEFLQGVAKFESSVPVDPSKREFGGMKRGPNGRFKDGDLVASLKASIEDPAGMSPNASFRSSEDITTFSSAGHFGPRMVPKALRIVEILSILQARKWYAD